MFIDYIIVIYQSVPNKLAMTVDLRTEFLTVIRKRTVVYTALLWQKEASAFLCFGENEKNVKYVGLECRN